MTYDDNKLYTNFHTFIIENNLLIEGDIHTHYGNFDFNAHYAYNILKSIAIFVYYDKYGKKYIKTLLHLQKLNSYNHNDFYTR